MIWEITYLLAYVNVLVIARTTQYFPGESSGSNENPQEHLEKLYRVELIRTLNEMPTLDETDVEFDDGDIKLLTEECDLDQKCLSQKEVSVKKYQQKMQAIQCIHGLLVLKVLEELQALEPISSHLHYLKNMLSLLNIAQWDAYAWQIEVFAFVEGLTTPNVNLTLYREHFRNNNERMRSKPLAFVRQCVQQKYLLYRGRATTSETSTISSLVEGVNSQMELMYRSGELDDYRNLEKYTVRNLMFWHIYARDDCFYSWSMYNYQLHTSNVTRMLLSHASFNSYKIAVHKWELDPIGGNKYNALISKCILLRLVHFVWRHLHIYNTIKSRTNDVDDMVLHQMWSTLVPSLKTVLRLYRFNENIYWSAILIMMDDLINISQEVLAAREMYTRNYFCQAAADLGLASASHIDEKLNAVVVSEDPEDLYHQIQDNSQTLNLYIFTIGCTLLPLDGTYLRILVSAEGNETFVTHETI